ncbi:hypothetical protein [uncultured Rothia sp.]|uniref:hypothetical protein n=1 Tax=uncultured Rothia sp. TaxID=316088 RepID=UPI003217976C
MEPNSALRPEFTRFVWSGVDLSQFDKDEALKYVETDSIKSFLTPFTLQSKKREWARAKIAKYCAIGGMGDVIVGSTQTVADELERWIDDTEFRYARAMTLKRT